MSVCGRCGAQLDRRGQVPDELARQDPDLCINIPTGAKSTIGHDPIEVAPWTP